MGVEWGSLRLCLGGVGGKVRGDLGEISIIIIIIIPVTLHT